MAQLRRAELTHVVSDLVARADQTANAIPARVVDFAAQARDRFEQLPVTMVAELRRRVNLLDLATRDDVEVQSKLGRNRVSFVLREFLDAQREHDEALVEALRGELQDALQSFAAAIDDDLLSDDEPPPSARPSASRRRVVDPDRDDDELDLVGDDGTGDDAGIWRAALDVADD